MAELLVPQINFSGLGELPQVYRQARTDAETRRILSGVDPANPNLASLAPQLLRANNPQAAMTLATLGNQQFHQGIQTQQLENEKRRLALTEKQAEEKPQYMQIDDGQGGKALVKIDPFGRGVSAVNVAGINQTPNNPYLPAGQMNESQSKDALYANRMLSSEQVLRGVENEGTSWWERLKSTASDKTGYNLRGPEYQKFDQAQRDFINATLRRESGAVISPSEFDNANKQYFPMPGDTPDVIKQKRANRAEAIRGIAAGAGKGYRPESVISASGEITANPATNKPQTAQQPATTKTAKPAPPEIIAEAKAAIAEAKAKGKDITGAVRKRLVENGYSPAGL